MCKYSYLSVRNFLKREIPKALLYAFYCFRRRALKTIPPKENPSNCIYIFTRRVSNYVCPR